MAQRGLSDGHSTVLAAGCDTCWPCWAWAHWCGISAVSQIIGGPVKLTCTSASLSGVSDTLHLLRALNFTDTHSLFVNVAPLAVDAKVSAKSMPHCAVRILCQTSTLPQPLTQ